jgi:hypothetical protein
MDDYQKHLERQLQQQQQQLRLQATDLNPPRTFPPPLQLQPQRAQQPPQWNNLGIHTQAPPVAPAPAGQPGFGRGLSAPSMGMMPNTHQPNAHVIPQQNFSLSPQPQNQASLNVGQSGAQKNRASPSPGSPVTGDARIISELCLAYCRGGEIKNCDDSRDKLSLD